jgi:hypothetical protein
LSFWGESEGQSRNAVLPDIYAEAFSAAVDFLGTRPFVDRERLRPGGFDPLRQTDILLHRPTEITMRYLVKARLKPGKEQALLRAIEDGTLGRGSVAGDEYLWDMQQARVARDGTAHWVEVCFCRIPLEEERPYWEEYFDLISVKDAHARRNCRDLNGSESWACSECDCTHRLENKLQSSGESFLTRLRSEA